MAAKSFLVADPSPPAPPFSWGRVPHEGDSRKIRAKYFEILGFSKRYISFVGFLLKKLVLIDLI